MKLTLVLWNIRSILNVGAILRTAEGLGVAEVVFCGYTPNPDKGLPHEREKLRAAIHKSALGAEEMVKWRYEPDISTTIRSLRDAGVVVCALEQREDSLKFGSRECDEFLSEHSAIALILGEERYGLTDEILTLVDATLEIPMQGRKESFNVSVAAGIAAWEITSSRGR